MKIWLFFEGEQARRNRLFDIKRAAQQAIKHEIELDEAWAGVMEGFRRATPKPMPFGVQGIEAELAEIAQTEIELAERKEVLKQRWREILESANEHAFSTIELSLSNILAHKKELEKIR